jgi:VIT1/CCC1 family predicted Fe2+/Mn2+ transporter
MVLTCTLGASLIVGIDRDTLRTTLIAALGCNIAWGVIDAALYIMGNAFVRSRNSRLMQAIRSAPDAAAALVLVKQAMEPRIGSHGRDEDRAQLYRSLRNIVAHADTKAGMVTADDFRSAIAVFVLVVVAALPSAVPFLLIGDAQLALRVANVVQVALLFVVGFYWARSVGGNGWGAGLAAMLCGTLLVAIAIVLGG